MMLGLGLGLLFGGFGFLLLAVAILVSNGHRKNRLQLRRLRRQVERLSATLRTPEERAELARRIEAIEARNRAIHGRFDSGGC